MAVLTDIRRIHMRRVLTGGVSAIVATEAISSDIGMVEDSRYPKRACVAIVALFARNDVAGWFAGCQYPVVAGTAASRHRRVVHVRDRAPGGCCMATLAKRGRRYVVGRLHRRLHKADWRMATCTGGIRAFEYAARVASVATDIQVGAVKMEPSGEMVKWLLCFRRRCEQQHAEQNGDECLHWIRWTSSKESLEWHRPQSKPN